MGRQRPGGDDDKGQRRRRISEPERTHRPEDAVSAGEAAAVGGRAARNASDEGEPEGALGAAAAHRHPRHGAMTPRRLAVDAVEDLRRIALVFDEASEARKSAALARCAARAIDDPIALVAYHDCLLCLLAYPQTHALRGTARAELVRVARAARQIVVQGPARSRAKLANTGIAWTPVTIGFGWDIARWLSRRFPKRAEIDSLGNADAPLATILAAALPAIESELVARDEDPADLLEAASAGHRRTRLGWLVTALERLQCDDALRAYLFDTLEAYIAIEPADSMLSRTFVRGLPAPTYYHRDGLLRSVDLASLLNEPLPAPRRLTQRARLHVVDAGRAMLSALGRETDAIALAYPQGVAWYDLGRGIAVALYAMEPARRSRSIRTSG